VSIINPLHLLNCQKGGYFGVEVTIVIKNDRWNNESDLNWLCKRVILVGVRRGYGGGEGNIGLLMCVHNRTSLMITPTYSINHRYSGCT